MNERVYLDRCGTCGQPIETGVMVHPLRLSDMATIVSQPLPSDYTGILERIAMALERIAAKIGQPAGEEQAEGGARG